MRWPGCGKSIRFGDREKHEDHKCHFRVTQCPNGCGDSILGYRLKEHLEGKNPVECEGTGAWVVSGCPLRDVSCVYVLGQKKSKAELRIIDSEIKAAAKEKKELEKRVAMEKVKKKKELEQQSTRMK